MFQHILRIYWQMIPSGKWKINFLQLCVTSFINHTPGKPHVQELLTQIRINVSLWTFCIRLAALSFSFVSLSFFLFILSHFIFLKRKKEHGLGCVVIWENWHEEKIWSRYMLWKLKNNNNKLKKKSWSFLWDSIICHLH